MSDFLIVDEATDLTEEDFNRLGAILDKIKPIHGTVRQGPCPFMDATKAEAVREADGTQPGAEGHRAQ